MPQKPSVPGEEVVATGLREVTLEHLPEPLAKDVGRSLEKGIAEGAVFEHPGEPAELFRQTVAQAIRSIQSRDRTDLLPRFLTMGPRDPRGTKLLDPAARHRLSDEETARAIRLIFSSAINSFKGALAELLAVGPLVDLAKRRHGSGAFEAAPTLYAGDVVLARKPGRKDWAKAADFHLLRTEDDTDQVEVAGVAEVKSFVTTFQKLYPQLRGHLARVRRGLRIADRIVPGSRVRMGTGPRAPLQVAVVPDTWMLSREVRFETRGDGRVLLPAEANPRMDEARVEQLKPRRWLVTLRWSEEALASVAHDMTFWYMGILGRLAFAERVPPEWEGMTPEEAGQNAVKAMLHLALLRGRTVREKSRAIALYNSYGFGFALGAHFVNPEGRREVLFPEDLDEIAKQGVARGKDREVDRNGERLTLHAYPCRIVGRKRRGSA